MKFRLQLFGFDQSAYERPAQKWVCGWASQGAPCHRGPDAKGHCCGGFVCQPKQNGSRWECARSAAAGGACANGPLPDGSCCQSIVTCRPVRSWRARRGLVVAWTLALTAGILCFGLSHWSHFVSPGPLSGAHAAILAHGTAAGCAACHTAPHNWMNSLDRDRLADSRLCLKCHQNESQFHRGDLAMLPHGLPASQLGPHTSAAATPAMAAYYTYSVSFASSPTAPTSQIACATCHHEHQDPHGKLASLDNQTCQACHAKQFHSFADGHPEFTQHKFVSNHSILFSHATHQSQHFGSDKFECAACHTPTSDGRITTASFESSCARCHSDHFNGKAEPSASGVVLLQIPALDLDTLKSLKVDIGQWPKYEGDPPVRLTPFMRLLLGAENSDYLAHLPSDLGQLSDATDEQIAAVQQLAWAIKSLLNGAGTDVTSLRPRLAGGLGREVSPVQFAQLTAGLSTDDIKAAADRWLPQLATELQKPFEKWNPSLRPKKVAPPASAPSPSAPKKAPSDDLFNSSAPEASPQAVAVVTSATIPIYADDLFNDSSPATKPSAPSPAPAAAPAKGGDDLFNDSGPATKPAAAPPTPAKAPAAGGDDLFNGDAAAPATKPAPAPAPPAAPAPAAVVPSAPVLSPSGWERNDDRYALIYHPTGHANTFLRAWLELAIPASAAPPTPWQSQLLSADVGGTCTKCHSPTASGSSAAVAWSPDSPKLLRRDFVKFSHRPHLLEPALQNCSACHAMAGPTDAPASIDLVSGFKFIQKQSCAACHAPTLASDSCLTCHNYHVTPMAEAAAVDAVSLRAK